MVNDGTNGFQASDEFCNILTGAFKKKFLERAENLIAFFNEDHEAKERKWDTENRKKLIELLQKQLAEITPKMEEWKQGERLFDEEVVYAVWPRPPEPEPETKEEEKGEGEPEADGGDAPPIPGRVPPDTKPEEGNA